MRKSVLLVTFAIIAMMCVPVYGQTKQELKVAKSRAKELTNAGWYIQGSQDLVVALASVNSKLNSGQYDEYVGEATNKKGNVGKAEARRNAIQEYVEYCKSSIAGRITTEMTDVGDEQTESFVSAFETLITKDLEEGVFRAPAYTLTKDRGNDKFDFRCVYLIDVNAADKAVQNAMKEAAEISGLAHDHANAVSDFIKKGFEK